MPEYSDKVMEHFKNPRNVGDMENPDGIGHVGNAVCGDIMELYIKVKDNIIIDAKFKTFGCGAAIATTSASAARDRDRRRAPWPCPRTPSGRTP